MNRLFPTMLLCLAAAACGADDSGGNPECGFVADLLPYEVGYTWTYRVTDLETGERTVKQQRLDRAENHPDYGEVIVQITEKSTGRTESLLRREGARILRFEQTDYDENGDLERVSVYQPYRLRIDEGLAIGEQFVESYTVVRTTPGEPDETVPTTDVWNAEAADAPCSSSLGDFECTKYRRVRTEGGVAAKDYLFAAGIGKVIEDGTNQLEELQSCGVTP